jgi:hypothetical protein
MSEPTRKPEVIRYEFDHPTCKGYGCCGGGGIVEAPEGYGDYVRYDDYLAIVAERDALTARLAACEWVVEVASKVGEQYGRQQLSAAIYAYRAAVAAETCERSAPITVGDTQGET